MAEDGRVAVRNPRREARKPFETAEKAGEISADELDRAEKEFEKVTHEHVETSTPLWGAKNPSCSRYERRGTRYDVTEWTSTTEIR